jgi:NAD(P)-dependent dehydrogenase (short-subunit alcohol dehydrogenase family)
VDLHLSEKRALVTGSTAGIGAAIARQLASEGVAVVVHGRDEQRGQGLAAELTGAGRRAVFIGADLARSADIARLASQARAALGAIDIFVNNAAIYPQLSLPETPSAPREATDRALNKIANVRVQPKRELRRVCGPPSRCGNTQQRAGWQYGQVKRGRERRSGSPSFVVVMQTADVWDCDDRATD